MGLLLVKRILLGIGTLIPVFFNLIDFYYTYNKIDFWKNYTIDVGPWCEKSKNIGFMKEKINANSSFIFLWISLYLYYKSYRLRYYNFKNNILHHLPLVGYMYTFINLIHWFGSFLNHSCSCTIGHRINLIGLYMLVTFWFPYYWFRYQFFKNKNPYVKALSIKNKDIVYKGFILWIMTIHMALFPITNYNYKNELSELTELGVVVFTFIICLILDYETKQICKNKSISINYNVNSKCILITITTIGLGIVTRKLDIYKIYCYNNSIILVHVFWHVFLSISTLLIFNDAVNEKMQLMNMLPLVNTGETFY